MRQIEREVSDELDVERMIAAKVGQPFDALVQVPLDRRAGVVLTIGDKPEMVLWVDETGTIQLTCAGKWNHRRIK